MTINKYASFFSLSIFTCFIGITLLTTSTHIDAMKNFCCCRPKTPTLNLDDALKKAAYDGDVDTMKLLLKANANPDATNSYGESSLFLATEHGHLKAMKLLLKANANPDATNSCGDSSLSLATEEEDLRSMKLLLKANANPDAALCLATEAGHLKAMKLLLRAKANPNQGTTSYVFHGGYETALHLATERGLLKAMKLLLEANADPNYIDYYPYTLGLLATEQDVAIAGDTALDVAIADGCSEAISLLLNNVASITKKQNRKIHDILNNAVKRNDTKAIQMLLDAEVDVSKPQAA